MANRILIVGVDRDDGEGLLVSFSDGTHTRYSVDELLELRPVRESDEDLDGI
jgi:hypothetical protein